MSYTKLLDREEVSSAYQAAVGRHKYVLSNFPSRHSTVMDHYKGTLGEIATAKLLNCYWKPSAGVTGQPDLELYTGLLLDVKYNGREGDLILRDSYKEDWTYVLVHGPSSPPADRPIEVELVGYFHGKEVNEEFWECRGGYNRYWIPPHLTRDLKELVE